MAFVRSLIVFAAGSALLAAQAEPLTIRLAPAPNQTIRMRMAQETSMDVEPTDPATSPNLAMKLGMTMSMATTTETGAADEQGRVEARMTFDDVTFETTMNGQPAPMPPPRAQFAGRVFTFVYDREGQMVDFKADAADPIFVALKPMMSNMLGATGSLRMAVGDTVTRTIEFPLAVPSGGALGSPTFEMRFTLNSVTSEGADHIAHLTTAMTGQMNPSASPSSGATAAIAMQMTGTGTMDVNVERGVVKRGEQRMTIDATIGSADRTTPAGMRLRGTMKMSQTLEP